MNNLLFLKKSNEKQIKKKAQKRIKNKKQEELRIIREIIFLIKIFKLT